MIETLDQVAQIEDNESKAEENIQKEIEENEFVLEDAINLNNEEKIEEAEQPIQQIEEVIEEVEQPVEEITEEPIQEIQEVKEEPVQENRFAMNFAEEDQDTFEVQDDEDDLRFRTCLGFKQAPEKEQAQSAVEAKEENETQQYHTPVEAQVEEPKSYEQQLVERWNSWNQANRQQLNPSAAMKSPIQQPTQQQNTQVNQNNYQQVMQRNNMMAQQYNMQRNMMNAQYMQRYANQMNNMNNQYRIGIQFAESNNGSVPNYNINAMAQQQYQLQQQRRMQFKNMIAQEVNPYESLMAMDRPQQAPTRRICLMCGSVIDGDSKFCSHCGTQM
jgi:hypothetical protein